MNSEPHNGARPSVRLCVKLINRHHGCNRRGCLCHCRSARAHGARRGCGRRRRNRRTRRRARHRLRAAAAPTTNFAPAATGATGFAAGPSRWSSSRHAICIASPSARARAVVPEVLKEVCVPWQPLVKARSQRGRLARVKTLHSGHSAMLPCRWPLLLAPHANGPKGVPRCGALSLLHKSRTTGGFSRNHCWAKTKLMGSGGACSPPHWNS